MRTALPATVLLLLAAGCTAASPSPLASPSASPTPTVQPAASEPTPGVGQTTATGVVAVLAGREADWEIRAIDMASGDVRWRFRAPLIRDLRWSPDGRWLAVIIDDETGVPGLELLSADGDVAESVADVWSAAWSPDSTRLAIYQHRIGLGLLDLETGGGTAIGPHWWAELQDWSPDGGSLLFASDESDPAAPRIGEPMDRLYRLDLADGSLDILTELGYHATASGSLPGLGGACWSAEGDRIALTRRDGASFHTNGFVLDPAAGTLTGLGRVGWDGCPWFSSERGQELLVDTGQAVLIMTPEGELLLELASGELVTALGWAPDGEWVLLARLDSSGIEPSTVEAVRVDGSERFVLDEGELADWQPGPD